MNGELDQVRHAIQESTRLSQKGEQQKALELLDRLLAVAIHENWNRSMQALSRHAAIIAELSGDLTRAKSYNEQALKFGPENAMALYGMAKILLQQGEFQLAKRYAAKCYEVSIRGGTEIDQARVELLGKHWPEFGVWAVDT